MSHGKGSCHDSHYHAPKKALTLDSNCLAGSRPNTMKASFSTMGGAAGKTIICWQEGADKPSIWQIEFVEKILKPHTPLISKPFRWCGIRRYTRSAMVLPKPLSTIQLNNLNYWHVLLETASTLIGNIVMLHPVPMYNAIELNNTHTLLSALQIVEMPTVFIC